jgi:hypothetical protein
MVLRFIDDMSIYYRIKQGDCLSSIAKEYGFLDYKAIYFAPENSDFRNKRPNPNIIFPGDILFIPDKDATEFPRPTDQLHRFCLKREKVYLRLRLVDDLQQPFRNKPYKLKIGKSTARGRTDADGLLKEPIPAETLQGQITIFPFENLPSDPGYTFDLNLGYLDPIDEISGVDARLINLGFAPPDHEDRELSEEERVHLLKSFQERSGLPITGEPDDATRRKLSELHDGQ